jgi:hypothetical protein
MTARNELSGKELPGKSSQEKTARTGQPGRRARTGPTRRLGQDRKLVSKFDVIREINIPPESCLYLKPTFLLIQFTTFPLSLLKQFLKNQRFSFGWVLYKKNSYWLTLLMYLLIITISCSFWLPFNLSQQSL